ncbi:hypothetical protein Scep_004364 [Stephania cephalantha]|uniref:Protein FAR1-RELATED SEQUENCE n=1 Tax=Stephania cephalantha TaxID=152367 RepID=A0AAP0KT89_9MAGN
MPFDSREEVLNWAQSTAKKCGFVVIILKSDAPIGMRARSSIGCERYCASAPKMSKAKNLKLDAEKLCKEKDKAEAEQKPKETASKKCGCLFKLNVKHALDDKWHVTVVCGVHNHKFSNNLIGHAYPERLTKPERVILEDLSKTSAKPKDILASIKDMNRENVTVIKTIYNERVRLRWIEAQGKTKM